MSCKIIGKKWAKCVTTETSTTLFTGIGRCQLSSLTNQAWNTLVITPFVCEETEAQKKVELSAEVILPVFSIYNQ